MNDTKRATLIGLVAALLTALQASFSAPMTVAPAPSSPPVRPRDAAPGSGWSLPERRERRLRLEDVAFEMAPVISATMRRPD